MTTQQAAYALVGIVALVILTPHVTIWAVNTLFDLSLGHGFLNWLAALWLNSLAASGRAK